MGFSYKRMATMTDKESIQILPRQSTMASSNSSTGITELAQLVALINENFAILQKEVPNLSSLNEQKVNFADEAWRKMKPEAGS
jgi:hypothetical protein